MNKRHIQAMATTALLAICNIASAGSRTDHVGSVAITTVSGSDILVVALTNNSVETNKPPCNTAQAFAISLSTVKGNDALSMLNLALATGLTVTLNGTGTCDYAASPANSWETIDNLTIL